MELERIVDFSIDIGLDKDEYIQLLKNMEGKYENESIFSIR